MSTPAATDPVADLPPGLRGPVEVALARSSESIPLPRASRGGTQYEPKWDGFRLAIVRAEGHTSLWSRQGKDLTAGFPDLAHAASVQIPPGFVLDGEAVVWRQGRLDFDALQRRLTVRGASLTRIARSTPATFVAFDILAAAGHDIRPQALSARRPLLEALARDWDGPLQLSPASTELAQAKEWFDVLPALGIEGVMAKALGQPYESGQRAWVKVKHRDTIDVVCGAVTGTLTRPGELVVGLARDGALRIVGRSSPLNAAAAKTLTPYLHPPVGPHPWPVDISSTALDRFNGHGRTPMTLIDPIVVEVTVDVALLGGSFRHPVRFVRTRPECSYQDLESATSAAS